MFGFIAKLRKKKGGKPEKETLKEEEKVLIKEEPQKEIEKETTGEIVKEKATTKQMPDGVVMSGNITEDRFYADWLALKQNELEEIADEDKRIKQQQKFNSLLPSVALLFQELEVKYLNSVLTIGRGCSGSLEECLKAYNMVLSVLEAHPSADKLLEEFLNYAKDHASTERADYGYSESFLYSLRLSSLEYLKTNPAEDFKKV